MNIDTNAPVFARREIIIEAPVEKVWNIQQESIAGLSGNLISHLQNWTANSGWELFSAGRQKD